jgi:hypothetical protein
MFKDYVDLFKVFPLFKYAEYLFCIFCFLISTDATSVEIPYKGGETSLLLILPGKVHYLKYLTKVCHNKNFYLIIENIVQISEFIAGGLSRIEGKIDSDSWDQLLR